MNAEVRRDVNLQRDKFRQLERVHQRTLQSHKDELQQFRRERVEERRDLMKCVKM